MASIRLYLETFQKHDLGRDHQLKYIDYMLADVTRLSDNISRILNLARIESRRFEDDFSWGDPLEVLDNFVQKNRHLFVDCRIRIVERPDRKLYCHINRTLLEILLMNLITNAIKYRSSQPPEITIKGQIRSNRLQMSFIDNGMGFDRNEKNKIFKKFYQIGRSDDMSAKGSGIGLYMAQNIAKIHKGKLSANSLGPQKGAVFTLTLPMYNERSLTS